MTKVVIKSSPNKGPDLDSPPKSQNLLKNPSSELCRFTDPEVDQFYTRFPPNTIFCSFNSSVRSDSVSSTWVCFPAALFQIGYLISGTIHIFVPCKLYNYCIVIICFYLVLALYYIILCFGRSWCK
ncbi:hypothetical protein Hanom_Chr00s004813g01725321 [Helianthus anomalus]